MQPDIDMNSVKNILKQSSDNYQKCTCGKCRKCSSNNLDLKTNALANIRKELSAFTLLLMRTSCREYSDIIQSELDALQMLLNEAVKLNNHDNDSVEIEPVIQVLIQRPFLKRLPSNISSVYWSLSRPVSTLQTTVTALQKTLKNFVKIQYLFHIDLMFFVKQSLLFVMLFPML